MANNGVNPQVFYHIHNILGARMIHGSIKRVSVCKSLILGSYKLELHTKTRIAGIVRSWEGWLEEMDLVGGNWEGEKENSSPYLSFFCFWESYSLFWVCQFSFGVKWAGGAVTLQKEIIQSKEEALQFLLLRRQFLHKKYYSKKLSPALC